MTHERNGRYKGEYIHPKDIPRNIHIESGKISTLDMLCSIAFFPRVDEIRRASITTLIYARPRTIQRLPSRFPLLPSRAYGGEIGGPSALE